MSNNKPTQIVTPKGEAIYPWISKPDTQFDEDGVFKTALRVDAEEAQALIEKIEAEVDPFYNETVEELKGKKQNKKARELEKYVPYEHEEDDDGNQTGYVIIKAKQNAWIYPKNSDPVYMQPNVFDAKKNPIKKVPAVGNGSVLKIAVQLIPFYNASAKTAGITARLKAVQVIELNHSGPSADNYGFDSEEDGFDAEDVPDEPGSQDDDEPGSDDDGEDDGDF